MFGRRNGEAVEKNPDGNGYRGRSGAWRDDHPRNLDERDYAPPEQRAAERMIETFNVLDGTISGTRKTTESTVDLGKLEREMEEGHRIKAMQGIAKKLTYGEMMELAQMLTDAMPEGSIDKEQFRYILPPTLHKWATAEAKDGS